MNIKYTFRSDQTVSSPLLNPDIFNENEGSLYPGSDRETFARNIQLIEQRIDAIQKELSYWDLYRITNKVEDKAQLDAVFSDLITGQSLVIACDSFISNSGDSLNRGDIIIKLASGDAALIKAVNSGYYKPETIEPEGNMLNIRYVYKEGEPEAEDREVQIQVQESDPSNSFIYGIYQNVDNNPIKFDIYKYNDIKIKPLIKFFSDTTDEEGTWLEEVVLDYNVQAIKDPSSSAEENKWQVTVTDKPSILSTIQVK